MPDDTSPPPFAYFGAEPWESLTPEQRAEITRMVEGAPFYEPGLAVAVTIEKREPVSMDLVVEEMDIDYDPEASAPLPSVEISRALAADTIESDAGGRGGWYRSVGGGVKELELPHETGIPGLLLVATGLPGVRCPCCGYQPRIGCLAYEFASEIFIMCWMCAVRSQADIHTALGTTPRQPPA